MWRKCEMCGHEYVTHYGSSCSERGCICTGFVENQNEASADFPEEYEPVPGLGMQQSMRREDWWEE